MNDAFPKNVVSQKRKKWKNNNPKCQDWYQINLHKETSKKYVDHSKFGSLTKVPTPLYMTSINIMWTFEKMQYLTHINTIENPQERRWGCGNPIIYNFLIWKVWYKLFPIAKLTLVSLETTGQGHWEHRARCGDEEGDEGGRGRREGWEFFLICF